MVLLSNKNAKNTQVWHNNVFLVKMAAILDLFQF